MMRANNVNLKLYYLLGDYTVGSTNYIVEKKKEDFIAKKEVELINNEELKRFYVDFGSKNFVIFEKLKGINLYFCSNLHYQSWYIM